MKNYICKKNIIFVLLLLISSSIAYPQAVIFTKLIHDFGKVKEDGGIVNTTFEFTNKGIKPVLLTDVIPSCGCTTPEWSRMPIEPNQNGFIKVSFDPKDKVGVFTKTITVLTDAEPATIVLTIKGEVTPKPKSIEDLYPSAIGNLRFSSDYVVFGDILHDKSDTASILVYNSSESPITFKVGETSVPNFLEFNPDKIILEPKQSTRLHFTYFAENKKDWGYCFDYIYIKTNDVLQPEKRINISANIKENFAGKTGKMPASQIDRSNHSFGDVQKNTQLNTSFTLKNIGQSTLIIRKLKPSCGCTVPKPEKTTLEPNESTVIDVSFNTGNLAQRKKESVTIITNDPKKPEIELWVEANVK
ncbi:MAG: hypothetical protein OHK0038_01420 [Flammeovirgaceae bacterium]